MKVLFENVLTQDSKTDLIVEKINNEIYLKIEYTNFIDGNNSKEIGHFLTKKQFKDFIGAMLHIQSKLNRNE